MLINNSQKTYTNTNLLKFNQSSKQKSVNYSALDKDIFISFKSAHSNNSRKPIEQLSNKFDNNIDILFPDIDGTIRDYDGVIPESARNALISLQDNGIGIVIATGRTYEEGKKLYSDLKIKPNYMITQQGAELVDSEGRIIYQKKLDKEVARSINQEVESYKQTYNSDVKMVIYVDGKPYSKDCFKLPYNWEKINTLDSFDSLLEEDKIPTKILLYEPDGDKNDSKKILHLINYMNKILPSNYKADRTAKHYCEITSPEATKGCAVKALIQLIGKDMKNVAAIGDSDNDLEMLKAVKNGSGLSISMGNALENIKDIAEYETLPIEKDGFAYAMISIIKNNEKLSSKKQLV